MKVAMWALWATAVGLGLLAMSVFVQGVIRHQHVGDPSLPMQLDEPTGWSRDVFRIWGEKPYRLHLASLELRGRPWQTWKLEARTVRPDAAFAGVHSYLTLRRVRDDPGMGGLMNYIMPIPGFLFLLISLLPANALSKRGVVARFLASATILILLVLLLFIGPTLLR